MPSLKQLFTGFKTPKPDEAAKAAQMRQEQRAREQERTQQQELSGRDKLLAARQSGPQTLFSATGAAGAKQSLGG